MNRNVAVRVRPGRRRSPAVIATVVALALSVLSTTDAAVGQAATPPTVSGVSPDVGPPAGGTRVTVTGTGFTGVSAVVLAGRAGTALHVTSPTQLEVTLPARPAGVHNVVVVTDHGSSPFVGADHFTDADPLAVTGVGPRGGPTSGGTDITVRGTGFTDVTGVDVGATPVTVHGGATPTQLVVTAPAGTAGTVDVRVVTGHGTSASGAADRFTYYAPSSTAPLRWSDLGTTDPDLPVQGGRDVSCTGSSTCVAVYGDKASAYDGTTWSPQTTIDDRGLVAVSCGTPTFCAAVDDGGAVVTDAAGTWAPRHVLSSDALAAVSCSSATFCVVLTATNAFTWNGTAWGGPTHIYDPPSGQDVPPSALIAVSCVSASFCVAAASDGETRVFRGTSWSAGGRIPIGGPIDSYDAVVDLDCVSSTFCAAVDRYQTRSIFDGTRWTGKPVFAYDDTAVSITCVSRTFCLIGDLWGDGSYWNGRTWSYVRIEYTEDDAVTVSCGTTLCATVGGAGDTFVRIDKVFTDHRQTFYYFQATDVSCVSPSFCMGVGGTTGTAGVFDGGQWSRFVLLRPLGHILGHVSCVTNTFCVAVGAGGWSEVYRGTWQPPAVAGPGDLVSLSCATTTFCVAGGSAGNVLTYDGSRWSDSGTVDAGGGRLQVSCPQAAFCLAADSAGRALTYDGTRWSAPAADVALHGGTLTLSCASRTLCAASTADGVATFDGSAWAGAVGLAGTADAAGAAVSCAGATCVAARTAATSPGDLLQWRFDGTAWSAPPVTIASGSGTPSPEGMSCTARPWCMIVSYGAYVTGVAGCGGTRAADAAGRPAGVRCDAVPKAARARR